MLTELVLEEGLGAVFDLRVKLVGRLCLIYKLMLHLESVDYLHNLALLDKFTSKGLRRFGICIRCRHVKLLDLINTLMNLTGLV